MQLSVVSMSRCVHQRTLDFVQVRLKDLEDKEIYVIIIIITVLHRAQIIRRGIRFLRFSCI